MPFAMGTELIGYHDLSDRPGFKMAMQEVDGRFFLYVAAMWEPGLSILDVTDPTRPQLVRWLEGPPNTWTIQVQVADGKLIMGMEHIPAGWSRGSTAVPPSDGFLIWDVTTPDDPVRLGTWRSGSTGTHRNFYAGGPIVHATSALPGFDGQLYVAVDISDPEDATVVGRWWWPGQHRDGGERYSPEDERRLTRAKPFPANGHEQHGLSLHGGAYVSGDRAYCSWMRGGLVILDISDQRAPRMVSNLPVHPPLGSTIALHTAVPLPDRNLVLINSEALRENCDEPVNFAGIVDVTDECDPVLISLFPQPRVPDGYPTRTFCAKGGRFGPHNQHQPQGQPWLQESSDLVYLTYFNAGLQIYDISEPRDPFIAASYIPDDPPVRRGPLPSTLVTQVEDVLVDRRGVIYLSEKNTGLHILGLAGRTAL